jgi:uncharacterized protein (DUF2147 family)
MNQTIKYSFIILFITIVNITSYGQTEADRVIGIWQTEEKDAKFDIYKSGNKYYGKLIWGKNLFESDGKTPKKDHKNPDPKLRSRLLLNLVLLNGFVYDDGSWEDGTIYDPKSGKTYSCEMELVNGRLKITGYIGITLLGRTVTWDRVK